MANRLQGKATLVTGGASGVGLEVVKLLLGEGARVAFSDINEALGQQLAAELGENAMFVRHDVSSETDWKLVMAAVQQRLGKLDVLVNNAGLGPRKQILELTDADWQGGMDVYFLSAIRPIRLVTPIMQAQKAGSVINISTAWAFEPSAMFPTSAVARAGLAAFTKIYADTYAPDNIRINNILPGWIDSLPATEERRQGVPMGRYGRAEEIAATVSFLASDGAGYITGQNLRVDGGITRSV